MRKQPKSADVDHVLHVMRRHRVSLSDLYEVGGEDLKSDNPMQREKARRVEKIWGLMARHGIIWDDLAKFAVK